MESGCSPPFCLFTGTTCQDWTAGCHQSHGRHRGKAKQCVVSALTSQCKQQSLCKGCNKGQIRDTMVCRTNPFTALQKFAFFIANNNDRLVRLINHIIWPDFDHIHGHALPGTLCLSRDLQMSHVRCLLSFLSQLKNLK